jgi:hypothetical protein
MLLAPEVRIDDRRSETLVRVAGLTVAFPLAVGVLLVVGRHRAPDQDDPGYEHRSHDAAQARSEGAGRWPRQMLGRVAHDAIIPATLGNSLKSQPHGGPVCDEFDNACPV